MQIYPSTQQTEVKALLTQVEKQGTPLRIEGENGTYYILSAEQLLLLLEGTTIDEGEVTAYTPEDFGLNDADVSAYETRRKTRRSYLDQARQTALDADLARRIEYMAKEQKHHTLSEVQQEERERLLHELDTAILHNIRMAAQVRH